MGFLETGGYCQLLTLVLYAAGPDSAAPFSEISSANLQTLCPKWPMVVISEDR